MNRIARAVGRTARAALTRRPRAGILAMDGGQNKDLTSNVEGIEGCVIIAKTRPTCNVTVA